MGEMSKSVAQIRDGEDPTKVLKARGIEYDGTSYMPQAPDIMGYILGLMLIWLLYTGFTSVREVFSTSSQAVQRHVQRAKEVTKSTTEALQVEQRAAKMMKTLEGVNTTDAIQGAIDGVQSGLEGNPSSKDDRGWTERQLDTLNEQINRWSSSVAGMLGGQAANETPELLDEEAPEPPTPTKRADPFESF